MEELDNSLKKIAGGALFVLIGLFISKLLGYVFRFIIARVGPEQYGLFYLGMMFFSFFSMVSILGMKEGVTRYVSYYSGKKNKEGIKGVISSSTRIGIISSIILAIMLFTFSNYISLNFFHNSGLSPILKIFAIAVPINTLGIIFLASLRGSQKVRYEVYIRNIGENLIKIVITTISIFLGFEILGVAFAYLIALFISLILSFYFMKRVFHLGKKIKAIPIGKELLFYSVPLLLAGFMLTFLTSTDTFMIGLFEDAFQVGIYNAAIPVAQLLYVFPEGLLFLFLPVLTKIYAEGKTDLIKPIYKTLTKWILIFNIMVISLIILFSKQILRILFGPEYSIGSNALIILTIGFFLAHLMMAGTLLFLVFKKTKIHSLNLFMAAILNIILNYFLIPRLGISGAAIATSVSFSFLGLIVLIENYLLFKLQPFNWKHPKIIFSSLIASFIIYFLNRNIQTLTILEIIILSFTYLAVYGILLLVTRTFEEHDIMILKAIQQKTGLRIFFINRIIKKFI